MRSRNRVKWLSVALSIVFLCYILYINQDLGEPPNLPLSEKDAFNTILESNEMLVYTEGDKSKHDRQNLAEGSVKSTIETNATRFGAVLSIDKYFMVVLIPSLPRDIVLRRNIRSQYMNLSAWRQHEFEDIGQDFLKFKIMFIVGKMENENISETLLEEISKFNDVFLGEELIESRKNLRYKILWGMRRSLHEFHYNYLVKVDQDTLVDLPSLLRGLPALARKGVYTGVCRNHLSTLSEYKDEKYRNVSYCQGGAYILSRDIVQVISDIDLYNPDTNIVPEDGYVGWLVKEATKMYNITTPIPQNSHRIISRIFPPVDHGLIKFNWWFYHFIKRKSTLDMIFRCMIKKNDAECPKRNYNLTGGDCQCST